MYYHRPQTACVLPAATDCVCIVSVMGETRGPFFDLHKMKVFRLKNYLYRAWRNNEILREENSLCFISLNWKKMTEASLHDNRARSRVDEVHMEAQSADTEMNTVAVYTNTWSSYTGCLNKSRPRDHAIKGMALRENFRLRES